MKVRTIVFLVIAVAVVLMMLMILAAVVVYRAATTPTPTSSTTATDVTLNAGEYIFQGSKYTRLSPNEPDGLPSVDPYGGLARSAQAAIPVDTEPAIWTSDWLKGLTGEQTKMYAEGLVRSGLEDLHMCKPGYTCHGTVNYRVYEQNRSDLPHILTLQMSFTTPTQHNEVFLLVEGERGKVWFMTDQGWDFTGVVEDLPESDRAVVYKLMSSSYLDDMKY
ncbi:MAG: hypothetical protein KW806_00590 [Candidatus Yanofskybacteria bacterium]|nr:hypothetical protein [Candidatus Yanofskybacteria bacterium]